MDAVADEPERTFEYLLPGEVARPDPGSLVLVPYGRRLALGYVLPDDETGGELPGDELRDVEAVVSGPILTPELLTLGERLATHYRAPFGITVSSMLPAGID